MKSKRRHELQENVLALEIGKVAEFLKKRGNHLATAALVIALIAFGYVFISRRSRTGQERLQQQWDHAMSAKVAPEERIDLLTSLAEQETSERIAALASVELGYEYALRSLTARERSERAALAEKAGQWYLLTIQKFPKQALAVAKAHYGLGKLREAARQFDLAAAEYRQAKASSDLTAQPVVRLAEVSLLGLKTLQDAQIRMATTAPATQPTTASRPTTTAVAEPTSGPAEPATRPVGKVGP